MKIAISLWMAVMASITLWAQIPSSPSPPAESAQISGIVLEAGTGRPLGGVRIALYTAQSVRPWGAPRSVPVPRAGETLTDPEGRFVIGVVPGRYRVSPELEGFVYFRPDRLNVPMREPGVWVRLLPSDRVENLDLHLTPFVPRTDGAEIVRRVGAVMEEVAQVQALLASGIQAPETRANRIRVTGNIVYEGGSGADLSGLASACRLRLLDFLDQTIRTTEYVRTVPCSGGQTEFPGLYWLEQHRSVPSDVYVVSARSGGRDFLAEGLQIDADTEFEIVFGSPGGAVEGNVLDSSGGRLSGAVVALVPDAPYRYAGVLYRSAVSDFRGGFELRGIRPGNYRLFAWRDLEGAAYRNADFLRPFEDYGVPVTIELSGQLSMDIPVID